EVSSQALWQRRVDGIGFEVCAMTNIYPDHVGAPEHPSFEHYVACKRRLMTEFDAPILIGNADDEQVVAALKDCRDVQWCALAHTAEWRAECIGHELGGCLPVTVFLCRTSEETCAVRLPLPGEHNVQNALFALSIAHALGVSLTDAAASLADVCIPGRFELLTVKGALVVIDYAHNGAALRAMLTSLRALAPERLLCLFGSVGGRTQCRRAELGAVADELADFTYLTADDPNFEPVEDICSDIAAAFKPRFLPNYTVIPDRAEAIRVALDELREGDVLLLAGKGDERTQRIAGQIIPHRDRDVVEAYIRQSVLPV
ncbi:MAG: UDP-N-acetylmuramyl peptide synthase, partial [Clostridia bacterium]|nr:UDP-N-acetylmuramyl peptide synthase [Clostridia bacterium]